ncbi:MAG: sigma-54-dependent transcriptional regulator [Chloroflexota bacterium]
MSEIRVRPRVLVVDDEPNMTWLFEQAFGQDHAVIGARDRDEAVRALRQRGADIVFLDLRLPGIDGMGILKEIKQLMPDLPVIMMTAHGTVKNAVDAMKAGAFDYVTKPFDLDEVRLIAANAMRLGSLTREVEQLRAALAERSGLDSFQAVSPKMLEVLRIIERVAPTDASVLISGESGTGKELAARAIHQVSPRRDGPFLPVNCAALPDALLESELFGYEKGAFTGATAAKPGRFELAGGGTLLLDEVGDMSLGTQAKLLRVLEERQIERLGGTRRITVDVRIVAATNRPLTELVQRGQFREDLYYRLAVIPIQMPPLRERPEDVPVLANQFLRGFAQRHGRPVRGFAADALARLQRYDWPGNVRELRNLVEQMVILADGEIIGVNHLPPFIATPGGAAAAAGGGALRARLGALQEQLEADLIRDALARCGGNRTRAAEQLGISRRSLQMKIKKYGAGT